MVKWKKIKTICKKGKWPNYKFRLFVFLFLSLSVMFSGCAEKNAWEVLPDQLLGMQKIPVAQGSEAHRSIEKSHIGNVKYLDDAVIVRYSEMSLSSGPDLGSNLSSNSNQHKFKNMMLWLSIYPNTTISEKETERMVDAMERFEDWGMGLNRVIIAEKDVYSVRRDVNHYFWADNKCMFYIIPYNLSKTEINVIINELKCDMSSFQFLPQFQIQLPWS